MDLGTQVPCTVWRNTGPFIQRAQSWPKQIRRKPRAQREVPAHRSYISGLDVSIQSISPRLEAIHLTTNTFICRNTRTRGELTLHCKAVTGNYHRRAFCSAVHKRAPGLPLPQIPQWAEDHLTREFHSHSLPFASASPWLQFQSPHRFHQGSASLLVQISCSNVPSWLKTSLTKRGNELSAAV